jgi:hypothetical protein
MKIEQEGAPRTGAYGDLIAFVARHMVCLACGQPYAPDDVRVLRHDDFEWMLWAECSVCRQGRSVTAYEKPPYEVLVPVRPTTPVGAGEVAAWEAYLAGFDGDMNDLLDDPD